MIDVCRPNKAHRKIISELIYSVKKDHSQLKNRGVQEVLTAFHKEGIDLIVLACTELPIVFRQLKLEIVTIGPTLILAMAAVEFAGARII